jgi:hypothetical protein
MVITISLDVNYDETCYKLVENQQITLGFNIHGAEFIHWRLNFDA